jgi:hypothetical protein
MKNATKGPLIIVTLGTLMILSAFLFSAKPKTPPVGPPLPPPPQP